MYGSFIEIYTLEWPHKFYAREIWKRKGGEQVNCIRAREKSLPWIRLGPTYGGPHNGIVDPMLWMNTRKRGKTRHGGGQRRDHLTKPNSISGHVQSTTYHQWFSQQQKKNYRQWHYEVSNYYLCSNSSVGMIK